MGSQTFKKLHRLSIRKTPKGFSLVQLSIATLLMSSLGIGVTTYMKRQNLELRKSDLRDDVRTSGGVAAKLLIDDIKQAVFLNPSSTTNPASSSVTTPASAIQVRAGVTPIPGVSKEDVDAMTTLWLPSNITADASDLEKSSDAIRLVEYDYTGTWGCRLNPRHSGSNPSTSQERLWIQRSSCLNASNEIRIAQGKIYIIVESFGTASPVTYSNLFQITAPPTDLGVAADEILVEASSSSNLFNQNDGLGLSGFTNAARIYPVKLVEWAVGDSGGLYRREIKPTADDTSGYQSWTLMQANVESIQFNYITSNGVDAWTHSRTMTWTSDTHNDGVEDIQGVLPWFVIKSAKPNPDSVTDDNPLTALVESDHYSRKDFKFFVDFRNYSN